VLGDKNVPGPAHETRAVTEIADESAGMQLGEEAFDNAVVDGFWRNSTQTAPAGET
jgi:hypothetical protein